MVEPVIVDCAHLDEQRRMDIARMLRSHLIEFNGEFCKETQISPVLLTVEHQGELCGGLVGRIAWGWLHIEILWLASELRGQGVGSRLMNEVEELALQRGCGGIYLDTFSFQAPDFYTRIGYRVFGKIEDFPKGNCRYFLEKKLAQQ